MREGNQSDKIDARRLAELLRLNHLNPGYYKEFVCSYLTVTKDLARVMAMIRTISLRSLEESWPLGLPGNQPKGGRKPVLQEAFVCPRTGFVAESAICTIFNQDDLQATIAGTTMPMA